MLAQYNSKYQHDFWQQVEKLLNNITGENLLIDKKTVFLGLLKIETNNIFINYILILAKSYIYSSKRKSKSLRIECFKEIIKNKYEIEDSIQKKKMSQSITRSLKNKWKIYQKYLSSQDEINSK